MAIGVLAGATFLSGTGPAAARPGEWGPGAGGGGESGSGGIAAQVKYTERNVPSGGGSSMEPLSGSGWEPPACWYEPKFSPGEFESWTARIDHGTGSEGPGGMRDHYGDFHKGDKGKWYWRVFSDDAADPPDSCFEGDAFQFIGPDDPPPPGLPMIDPEVLAGLAYKKMKLPTPPVKLSPRPDNQVVNLETYAKFDKGLDRTSVTAELPEMDIAATTVATPTKLRLEAGSADAKPGSCTYDLTKSGGGYAVDTEKSGCNITYRRSSGGATYSFKAYLTWEVHWTASADPDGPAEEPGLPDGESVDETAVTVKEVQSIVR